MGYDYFDMTPRLQSVVYKMAMDDFSDMAADKADMMRKNEAAGGMMRSNYANGSEDKFMELVERLREQGFSQQEAIEEARERLSKNMANGGRIGYAFGSDDKMDQASGIKSLEGTKMASAPDPMAEKNDMSLDLFGKPLELLDEEEMEYLEMQIEDRFGKRDAPSIKMASDDSAMDEYRKYVFEMQEQGIEPVSFREFLAQVLSEARG
ncbi:MAG: hypothetical protein CMK80_00145 [Pseudomonadales bacterium]|nr:hypothetical protein [Pseudomonadales bacterium]